MKIRYGFVSNSSSSSFCIYGANISWSDVEEKMGKNIDTDDEDEFDEYSALDDMLDGTDLEQHSPYDSGEYFVGISWSNIRDNETGKEFKARVLKQMQKAGFKVEAKDLGTHEEAWYAG